MDDLNRALDHLEANLAEPVDGAALARLAHTSEHHLRRMFATLAGMGLADYVRRRRMTLAAAEVVAGEDTTLAIATHWGYASGDSFARAFRAVHGIGPEEARAPGATLAAQPRITFQLTTTGGDPVRYRLVTTPPMRLVGWSRRVPLVHRGPNPEIQAFVASISVEDTIALKASNDVEPRGVLAVCTEFDDREEGSMLRYLHGVATSGAAPDGLDSIEVPATDWAVFTPADASDAALQALWPYVFTEWFAASGHRLAPGPEIVAMQRIEGSNELQRELWIPVERAT